MIAINTSQPCIGYAETRQGGRAENQDTCAYSETPLGLLVTVCDGMGGGPSGKLASTIAARNIIATLMAANPADDRMQALRQAILNANAALYRAMDEDPSTRGMGSTATALLINAHSAVVAHVGDSRVYQLHGRRKKWRTFDHSMVFQMVKSGAMTEEQARVSANSNIILRALGHSPDLQVDVAELPYKKGDRFMLCSDGIWGMFPEPEILKIVAKNQGLGEAVESLVVKVDAAGVAEGNHHDNLTVAMVETQTDSQLKDHTARPWLKWAVAAMATVCVVSVLINIYLLHRTHGTQEPPAPVTQQEEVTPMTNVKNDTAPVASAEPQVIADEHVPAEQAKKETEKTAENRKLDAQAFGIKPDPKPAATKKAETKKPAAPAKKTEEPKAAEPAEKKAATEAPAAKPAAPADTTKK